VLWSDDEEYYRATVTQEQMSKKRPLSLIYDDGDSEWVDLRQHKFRLVEGAPYSSDSQKYPIGTIVKAFFRGSGWWNGEITSYDGKFYRIIYEDGDTETASEKELASIVLSPELARMEIGCRVAVRWPNDGKYYNGTVCRERNTEKPFCVAYDSGDYEWIDFHRRKFRLLEGADERKSVPPAGSIILSRLQNLPGKKYAIGTKVEKYYEDSGWYNGEVIAYKDDRYRVLYEDNEIEVCTEQELGELVVTPDLAKVEIGSRVALHWPDDDTYYEATVTRKQEKKDRFLMEYIGGEHEWVDLHERKFRLIAGRNVRQK
jgi:hypothetical protein